MVYKQNALVVSGNWLLANAVKDAPIANLTECQFLPVVSFTHTRWVFLYKIFGYRHSLKTGVVESVASVSGSY